jgi:hypothetical protein
MKSKHNPRHLEWMLSSNLVNKTQEQEPPNPPAGGPIGLGLTPLTTKKDRVMNHCPKQQFAFDLFYGQLPKQSPSLDLLAEMENLTEEEFALLKAYYTDKKDGIMKPIGWLIGQMRTRYFLQSKAASQRLNDERYRRNRENRIAIQEERFSKKKLEPVLTRKLLLPEFYARTGRSENDYHTRMS